jgi:hypothetical protein
MTINGEERERIEAIWGTIAKAPRPRREDTAWLLDLIARQEAELRWVGERMIKPLGIRDTGISSDALVAAVVLGCDVPERSYPHDLSDLGRCQRAVDFAPAHVKPRAQAILDTFNEHCAAVR